VNGIRWHMGLFVPYTRRRAVALLALIALMLTLLPVGPAMAASGDSTATLTTPPEGGTVGSVTSVKGTAYDPDGVTGVSVAFQNASGQYLQHLTDGGWASTFKAFSGALTEPDADGNYTWEIGPIFSQIFTEGTYTVTILVNDGTNIDSHQKSFSVDATGPVLSDPVPQPNSFIAGSSQERFAITAADTPAGVSIVELVYKIGATGTETTISLTAASGGVYEATVDLSGTTVGDVVYYSFTATDNASNTSTSTEYTVTVDKQAPAEVTNPTVTAPAEGGKLVLGWTDPTDADYAQAKVYYKDVSAQTQNWTSAGSAAKGEQTFTITGLDASGATNYAVKVTTVDNFGNESTGVELNNQNQGYAAKDVKPPAEVSGLGVTVVPSGGALSLEWTHPEDADYKEAKIYVKKLADASWTVCGSVGATSDPGFEIGDLINGVPYAVKVTTVDQLDNESAGVVADNGGQGYVPTDTQAPGEVTNVGVRAPASGGVITLTWTDPVGIDLNHIKVYMREKGSDAWGNAIPVSKGTGRYEFNNLDRSGQTKYEFKISVVDAAFNESAGVVLDNNGQGYNAQDTVAPSEATGAEVTIPLQGGSLKVQWSDPSDADLHHINVYCRPVGTTGDAWGTPQQVAKGVGSCLITGLANGHAYEVKVTAVDDIGNESTGVILNNNGQGYLPTQTPVDTTPPGEVTDLTVSPSSGAGVFDISFTAPSDQDLTGVAVYVAVYGAEDWALVSFNGGDTCSCDPGDNVTLVVNLADDFVLGKDRVQFKVAAVDSSGNGSQGVVADNGGQGYPVLACWELTPGPDGWRTFSVPVQLAGGQKLLGGVIDLGRVDIAYKFDAATQQWMQVTADNNTIQPLEAVYVKLKDPVLAVIRPTTVPTNPPVKNLAEGWNLVGFTKADYAYDALYSVRERWSAAVSPAVNPNPWAVTPWSAWSAMEIVETHYGYWVYMDEPGNLAGFSSTPVTVGTYPYDLGY